MPPNSYRGSRRFNVYSDAGRATGDMQLIAANVSSTAAYGLQRLLVKEGWKATIEEVTRENWRHSPGFAVR